VWNRDPKRLRGGLAFILGFGIFSIIVFAQEDQDGWLYPAAACGGLLVFIALGVLLQGRAVRGIGEHGRFRITATGAASSDGIREPEVSVGLAASAYRGKLTVDAYGWDWAPKGKRAPTAFSVWWEDIDCVVARPTFGIRAEVITIRSRTGLWVGFLLSRSQVLHDFIRSHAQTARLDGLG